MAKRKLSDAQRAAIRKKITQKLSAGTRKSEVLASVAKEYKISPESVRWYLKSMGKGGSLKPRKATATANGHAAPKAGKSASTKGPRKSARPSSLGTSLLEIARNITAGALRRALEAKKLLPKLETLRKKYATLEQVEKAAKASLGLVADQLRSLENRIRRLTKP